MTAAAETCCGSPGRRSRPARPSYSVCDNTACYSSPMAGENPFRYGDVVSGTQFTDRRAEIAALRADVESGQNVVVIAPRRTGKSSLMRACVEELRGSGVLVAECDLFAAPDKGR